jgi:predicted peptidase
MLNHHVAKGKIVRQTILPYTIEIPKGKKSCPLIIFLHMAGCNGDTHHLREMFLEEMQSFDKRGQRFAFAVPQCPFGTVWHPDYIARMVLDIIKRYKGTVDPNRIYLTGFSMGARGVWDTAMEHPSLFAAISPIAGYGCYLKASRMHDLPSWSFHGEDDNVVPAEESIKMYDTLKGFGDHHRCSILKNVGHGGYREIYTHSGVLDWFLNWSADKRPNNSCIEESLESLSAA